MRTERRRVGGRAAEGNTSAAPTVHHAQMLAAVPEIPVPRVRAQGNVDLVPAQVKKFASAGGCVGALLILPGVLLLPTPGFVIGLVVIAIGLLVGSIGGKKTVMLCPKWAEREAPRSNSSASGKTRATETIRALVPQCRTSGST